MNIKIAWLELGVLPTDQHHDNGFDPYSLPRSCLTRTPLLTNLVRDVGHSKDAEAKGGVYHGQCRI